MLMFSNRPIPATLLLVMGALATAFASADNERLTEAILLYDDKQYDAAQTAFEELLGADKNNAEIRYHLGMLALRRDDFERGIIELETAVELSPTSSEYHRGLGDAYGLKAQNTGMFSAMKFAKKCKRSYEAAVAADPTNIRARWCLMEYCKEAPGFIGGSMTHAYAQAGEIEKLDPVAGRWARATVLLKDKKPQQALALYEGALGMDPPSFTELYRLGLISSWTGLHMDAGLQALDRCLALSPGSGEDGHDEVQVARGRIFEKLNETEAARLAYQAALKLDPDSSTATDALHNLN